MKRITTYAIALVLMVQGINAQTIDNPGAYMTAISNAHVEMNKMYMAYMSAVGHGRRARKVEKLRMQTLESITQSRYKTIEIPIYKGDNTLRQSSIDYIKLCYDVFNDDYAKIVNMEEIAEQSVDGMQAYMLLQEETEKKLKEASTKMHDASKAFAARYNVTLVDSQDELDNKMEAAGKLTRYYNKLYMIFFKCNWQDGEIVRAMNAKKLNDVEQGRNALIRYATEGMKILDTLKHLNGDPSMNVACKDVMRFYKKMAENDIPKVTDFYLKEENFDKMKKAFESNNKRTQADIDAYNKGVNEINAAVNTFNQANNEMNNNRKRALDDYEKARKAFFETHMPKYRA